MNTELKEQIRTMVRNRIVVETSLASSGVSIDGVQLQEALYETYNELYDDESIAEEVREGVGKLITEGVIDRVLQKGLERYPMMFLEKGDQRYFFVKSNSGVEWAFFKGQTLEDRGTFDNDEAGAGFIQSRMSEGFKPIKSDGGVKKFFKAIGRGLAILFKVMGSLYVLSAIMSIVAAIFLPSIVPPMAAGYVFTSSLVGVGLGLTAIGGGWLIGKLSKKKATMPDTSTGDANV